MESKEIDSKAFHDTFDRIRLGTSPVFTHTSMSAYYQL